MNYKEGFLKDLVYSYEYQKDGWDGYDAKAITKEEIFRAIKLIEILPEDMECKRYVCNYETNLELNYEPQGTINISYGLYQRERTVFLLCLYNNTNSLVAQMHDFEIDIIEELRCLKGITDEYSIEYYLNNISNFKDKITKRVESLR